MVFQPFDPNAPVRFYFTNMPHWRQRGCTYFVTYRLADSIPKSVLNQWEEEKRGWFLENGCSIAADEPLKDAFARLPEKQQFAFQKCFNRKLNEYLDQGRGSCLLRDLRCSKIVMDGWKHFHETRYFLYQIIVMPNHVHLLIAPLENFELEDILHSRKGQSAREINRLLGRVGQPVWRKHSFDHIVRTDCALTQFEQYIADNPRNAGLEDGSHEYSHSRFGW